jgi:hypothetical protein
MLACQAGAEFKRYQMLKCGAENSRDYCYIAAWFTPYDIIAQRQSSRRCF